MKVIVYRTLSVMSVIIASAIAFSFEFSVAEDVRSRVESINSEPPGRIEPLPEYKPRFQVTFDEINDPFQVTDSDTDAAIPVFESHESSDVPTAVKLKPGDLSLLGREAGRALIKLPDGAVYLVEKDDVLWDGDVIIQEIDDEGVTVKYTSSNKVVILNKFEIR